MGEKCNCLIPPFRFARVEETLFRGAYPTKRNFPFLRILKLKTIISVTPKAPTKDLEGFCAQENIKILHFHAEKFNDCVTISSSKVSAILGHLVQQKNHPVFIHCLDGAHTTGHIIMCLRKLQNWTFSGIFSEFCRFTKGGEMSRDESQFVESFKGEVDVPDEVPPWLWDGIRVTKHPTIKISMPHFMRMTPAPISSDHNFQLISTDSGDFRYDDQLDRSNTITLGALFNFRTLSADMRGMDLEGLPPGGRSLQRALSRPTSPPANSPQMEEGSRSMMPPSPLPRGKSSERGLPREV